ncbi:MAG: aerobic carbon-monoxide dehydrogenase large subunit [Actinomycetota bacterium]
MTTSMFGESVQRREDDRLVRGAGTYVDDLGADALSVAFVRSHLAHARIVDIDVSEAVDVPGVVAVYTHADLPDRVAEPMPLLIPHPSLTEPRTQYALAKSHVHHVGEAVVMVLATDRYAAEDATERVYVEYEELPAVVGIETAARGDVVVHEDMTDNVAAHLVQEVGEVDAAFASAPHVLEFDLDMERSTSSPLEGRGVHAVWDERDRKLTVHSSTQAPTSVRFAIANIVGLPDQQVDVIAPDIGGGFGVKIMHPWPEEILVPWAAREWGRAVKFVDDRREHFLAANHERGQLHHVRVGFDDEGRILGLDVRFDHDHGAYIPYGLILPIITSTQLPGPYVLPAYRVEFRSLYTTTMTCTPYRGAGRPQGVFTMERTVDKIAAELGLDRATVRDRNLIQPDQFPYDLGLTFQDGRPAIYDSGNFPELLRRLRALVGWDDFAAERAAAEAEGRRIGIGMGLYVEGTGVGPYEGGHVRVETTGRVQVSTGLSSQGQGHETVFAQIVADELGVPFESVDVVTGDTRRFAYAVGTFASRAAVMSGNAIALAAREVKAKALRIAAEALEANPDDLEIIDGIVSVKGTPARSIPITQVAVLSNPLRYSFSKEAQAATQFTIPTSTDLPPVPAGEEPGLEGTGYYSPVRSTFASGAHAAVIETDPLTAEIRILRYAVVHDCGRIINPMILEGQIHGGVAQGVAGALYERMAYDDEGQLLNASFMDFLMPYVTEIPTPLIDHIETPSPLNPLGIKGAGEAGVIPVTAAIASAIEDAEGISIDRMPISPDDLFELRRSAGSFVRPSGKLGVG